MNRVRAPEGRWIRRRMALLCGVLGLGLGVIVSSAFGLMVEDGEAWRILAERQRERRLKITPKRGMILDRNGVALAVSIEVPTVSLDAIELLRGVAPENVPGEARAAAQRIAQALGIDSALVEKKILARRRWSWLKRHVTPAEVEAVRQLSEGTGPSRLRGLIVEGEPVRYYPRRELASPLLGFVAPDGKGKDGLELALEDQLAGHPEQLRGLRDRSGHLIFDRGTDDPRAFAGYNVYLTIDQALQFVAERELELSLKTFEAVGGTVVAIDPKTGEILAMASAPSYNGNDYRVSDMSARRNRAVSESFEPGSTMKIFTVAAALDKRVLSPTDELFCEKGAMRVDNVTIRDTHPAEWLAVPQILAQSSNICSAKIGLTLGSERLYESFRAFGFGESSNLPLTGEVSGTLRPAGRSWVQVETASAAFGQGIGVTTLQMAMATGAIAEGGELLEPVLLRRVETATGEVLRESGRRVRRRVVSERVARQLAEMLVAVTEDGGTGVEAALPGYLVAGKTATAQKADPKTGRYSLDDYVASFVGFVPAHEPEVVIAVTIDSPRIEHAGGSVAAPVFRKVAEAALRLRGVGPRGTRPEGLAALSHAADPARAFYAIMARTKGERPVVQELQEGKRPGPGEVRLPDLTGIPMRSALRMLSGLGLAGKVNGTGLLAEQRPAPGAVVSKGGTIELFFRPGA